MHQKSSRCSKLTRGQKLSGSIVYDSWPMTHRLWIPQKNLSRKYHFEKIYIWDVFYMQHIIYILIYFFKLIFSGEVFLGNCSDFKLENRMYIHVCSALKERHIIYHLFNQLWWFLKEKAPIDGGKGGFTSHTLTVPRPKSLLFSLWSLNMLIIALNCYHFQNNCLVSFAEFCERKWTWPFSETGKALK